MTPLAVILIVLFAQSAVDGAQDFEILKQRALSKEPDTDFLALRIAYTETTGYDPLFSLSDRYRHALGLVAKGNRDTVLRVCSDKTPALVVSIEFHQVCASRLADLAAHDEAEVHSLLAEGLLASLAPDEHGEILIVEVEEQYRLAEWKSYKVIGHATLEPTNSDSNPISALKVVAPDGTTRWLRFRKHVAYERFQRGMIRRALEDVTE